MLARGRRPTGPNVFLSPRGRGHGAALAHWATMTGPEGPGPALPPDTPKEDVHGADTEISVRLVPKRDRRQRRLDTPDCPCCLWSDAVTVSGRTRTELRWH